MDYSYLAYLFLGIVSWFIYLELRPVWKSRRIKGDWWNKTVYMFYLKQNLRMGIIYITSAIVTRSTMSYFGWGNPIEITSTIITAYVSGIITATIIMPLMQTWYCSLNK